MVPRGCLDDDFNYYKLSFFLSFWGGQDPTEVNRWTKQVART